MPADARVVQMEAISPGLLGRGPLYKAKHAFASNYCGGTMCAILRVPRLWM